MEATDSMPQMQSRRAPLSLNVLIVGAGIGGLSIGFLLGRAGHNVTILEAASELGEVGAGIQVTPNMTKLLIRWGAGERLKAVAVVPQMLNLRRYSDGEMVGWKLWGDNLERDHGAPYYHIHRADLQRILLDLAKPFVNIRLNSKVQRVDPSLPTVTLESGETLKADLIIGADGLNSRLRDIVVGHPDKPTPTGDATYRALIPTGPMMKDSDLRQLLDESSVNVWMGPGRHIVSYCVRNKKEYNLVMIHPCKGTNETARPVDTAIMRSDFTGFEPRVQKMLSLVPSTLVWSLMDREPLDTWIHSDGKVCLLGDACHPMLPYRAQGSAMAVEDAAVLGNLLSRISSPNELTPLLRAYQFIRHGRASATQMDSRMNQHIFHLPDGPQQEARDASMRAAMEEARKEARLGADEDADGCVGSANLWGDRNRNMLAFDYDADKAVEEWLKTNELGETIL